MNCAECQEQLVSYIEHLLDDAQKERIAAHVKDCADCRAELEALQSLQNRLTANGQAALQSDFEEEVMNRIIREQNVRLKSTAQASVSLRLRRLIMKSPITKVAIAAAVIVAAVIGIHGLGGGTPAFADVVRPILEAHTVVFKVITHITGQPTTTIEGQFMDPGLGRHVLKMTDDPDEEAITIIDYLNDKGVVLLPARKMAMTIEVTNRLGELDPGKINYFQVLRDRVSAAEEDFDESVTYLGESEIDGRKVIGYRMNENGGNTTVWADVDSLLPLQIEYAMTETVGSPVTVTMMDIEFNLPLDPADFSTEIPEGYTVTTIHADASTPSENDVIEMLRISAEATGGQFPVELTLDAMGRLGQAHLESQGLEFSPDMDLDDPAMREWLQVFQQINRSLKFVRDLPKDADWHYAGTDAVYGDATTPVFWYRPENSETYRVIYADLSVADVVPQDLPQ